MLGLRSRVNLGVGFVCMVPQKNGHLGMHSPKFLRNALHTQQNHVEKKCLTCPYFVGCAFCTSQEGPAVSEKALLCGDGHAPP